MIILSHFWPRVGYVLCAKDQKNTHNLKYPETIFSIPKMCYTLWLEEIFEHIKYKCDNFSAVSQIDFPPYTFFIVSLHFKTVHFPAKRLIWKEEFKKNKNEHSDAVSYFIFQLFQIYVPNHIWGCDKNTATCWIYLF